MDTSYIVLASFYCIEAAVLAQMECIIAPPLASCRHGAETLEGAPHGVQVTTGLELRRVGSSATSSATCPSERCALYLRRSNITREYVIAVDRRVHGLDTLDCWASGRRHLSKGIRGGL